MSRTHTRNLINAVLGIPDRKYLWLLARTYTIPQQRYAALVAKARQLGFDVSHLIKDKIQR